MKHASISFPQLTPPSSSLPISLSLSCPCLLSPVSPESRRLAVSSLVGPKKSSLSSLSSRHSAERARDRDRLSRLLSEASTLKALALTGAYDGMNLAVAKQLANGGGGGRGTTSRRSAKSGDWTRGVA